MFEDIVKIITFTLSQIEDNKIKKNACMEIYDVYRQIHELHGKAGLVISYLSRDIDYEDIHTSFGTPTKKWLYFLNKQIAEYENIKYGLFCKLSRLDSEDLFNTKILGTNFISKSLNCKIDKYTKITHIDNELQLHIYMFNLIKDNCPSMRNFETLFTKTTVNISSSKNKTAVIDKAKKDYKILEELLNNFKNLIEKRCTIKDLFHTRHKELMNVRNIKILNTNPTTKKL